MNNKKLIATAEAKLIKIEGENMAHHFPVEISGNSNFPLKLRETNVVELYEDCIIIRPKRKDD